MLPPRTSSFSVHPLDTAPPPCSINSQVPLKVMLFIEATTVNGAAKSLLNFCDTVTGLSAPVSVSIATFHRGPILELDSPNAFVEAVRKRGIMTYVIPERRRFDHQLFRSIRAVIHRAAPDLVQTNNVKSHFLIKAARVDKHCRWIAFHHGYTATDLKIKCYNQLDRWSLRSAERVVTVCKAFEQQLAASGVPRNNIRVVHNSGKPIGRLSEASLNQLRARLGLNAETKVLLSVGRLSREKGQADLITAAKALRQLRPALDFKIALVGSGPEQASLEVQTKRLSLQSKIVFACNEPDVTPFFNIADVFVLPSHTEGSPHVIFEAMGAGVPIVATRVGGVPEILQHDETAILAPPRRPELLATAIAQMLDANDAAQTCVSKARQVLEQKHSPEAYARSLLGIYAEAPRPGRINALSREQSHARLL